jgi:hypothetical protein
MYVIENNKKIPKTGLFEFYSETPTTDKTYANWFVYLVLLLVVLWMLFWAIRRMCKA